MSVLQTMEAAQTTAATVLAPTAVPADNTLIWTQMGGTAPVDLGSYGMILQSLVMVRNEEPVFLAQLICCTYVVK